jgi:hypothetical protein
MAGVTSIEVKESLDELVQQLQQVETPKDKERLQGLYWLKQEKSPSISRSQILAGEALSRGKG